MEELSHFLDFAVETAYLAGKISLSNFRINTSIDYKKDGSIVTSTDRQIEEFITARIARYFPQHCILGEEFGAAEKPNRRHRWIIDPIDGTISFVNGVPLYSTLLALEINGIPVLGVANFAALNEQLYAANGHGCYLNGKRVHVDDHTDQLSGGIVTMTEFKWLTDESMGDSLNRIVQQAKQVRGWGDAYGYALVAQGYTVLHLDAVMKVWDCAPFLPILKEAGGYFGSWTGDETIYTTRAMATTPRLLPEILRCFEKQKEVSYADCHI